MWSEGLPVSWGRCAGDGLGDVKGEAKCFVKLFTLLRFRRGESWCSECSSWWFESGGGENGENTGERKGEGRGTAIERAEEGI